MGILYSSAIAADVRPRDDTSDKELKRSALLRVAEFQRLLDEE